MNEHFENGSMSCQVVSYHTFDMSDSGSNVAIVKRLNDNTFIVVRNLMVENGSGDWAYAIEYNIESLTEATQLFIKKIS